MVGLVDIAPSTRTIRVGGKSGVDVPVYGVSAKGIASLLRQFPNLKDAVSGGKISFTVESILEIAPDAVAAIIAAGTGDPGNPAAIEKASNLPAAKQMEFMDAIVEETMPDGIGPFMDALNALVSRLDLGDRGKAPVLKSE